MIIQRKFGKLVRGRANPFQIFSASILGMLIGFVPGFQQARAPDILARLPYHPKCQSISGRSDRNPRETPVDRPYAGGFRHRQVSPGGPNQSAIRFFGERQPSLKTAPDNPLLAAIVQPLGNTRSLPRFHICPNATARRDHRSRRWVSGWINAGS